MTCKRENLVFLDRRIVHETQSRQTQSSKRRTFDRHIYVRIQHDWHRAGWLHRPGPNSPSLTWSIPAGALKPFAMLIATTCTTEMIPLVRIPATEYHFIARVLDMGAMGIMVPMVENAAQAATIVASAKVSTAGATWCGVHGGS